MVYRSRQTIIYRRISCEWETLKEMFSSLSYQGIKNQNYFVITVSDIIFILEVCYFWCVFKILNLYSTVIYTMTFWNYLTG